MNELEKSFLKLTPTDTKLNPSYKKALDFAFDEKNDDLKNIAMTGNYASGKSSVISAYKNSESGKKLKFLHISLARFNDIETSAGASAKPEQVFEDVQKQDDKTNYSTTALIEGKIINQLLHQLNPDDIPQVRFKLKQNINEKQIISSAVTFILLAVSFIFLIYPNNHITESVYRLYTHLKLDNFVATDILWLILFASCCILSGFTLFNIIKFQKERKVIKSLSIQGNTAELFEENEDSLFDKYLDDTLYLFKRNQADVIVFEDIDRFGTVEIFDRLHQISTLINNKQYNKKTTKFLYLLRDDLFTPSDKTKFFDFIIPIIPVMDNSNSYNMLLRLFNELSINKDDFDHVFLRQVCLFIDDIRLLKNICNEYKIYEENLSDLSAEMQVTKLLSLIIYKNIYPYDFSNLQYHRGFAYKFINSEPKIMDDNLHSLLNAYPETNKNKYFGCILLLLRDKYINKDYEIYLSYFYPNSLTYNDKAFILSVLNNKPKPYNLELQKIDVILEHFKETNFESQAILNFDLIKYLSVTKDSSKHIKYLEKIYKVLDFHDNWLANIRDFVNEYVIVKSDYMFLSKLLEYSRNFIILIDFLENSNTEQHIRAVQVLVKNFPKSFEYICYYSENIYTPDCYDYDGGNWIDDLSQDIESLERKYTNYLGDDSGIIEIKSNLHNKKLIYDIYSKHKKNRGFAGKWAKYLIYLSIFNYEATAFELEGRTRLFIENNTSFLDTSDIELNISEADLAKFKTFCKVNEIEFAHYVFESANPELEKIIKENSFLKNQLAGTAN